MAELNLGSALRDAYGAGVESWAADASLFYGPLAVALVSRAPIAPANRVVLDAGAGTGVISRELMARGARVVATDLAQAMLARDRSSRPPAIAADVMALALVASAVQMSFAAFVLNHLVDPALGLIELRRVTAAEGWILANAFSTKDRFPVKDEIDAVAVRHGWSAPDWYRALQENTMPKVGSAEAMAAVAAAAGLHDVEVTDSAVEIGVFEPAELVRYRLGMPQLRTFLDALTEQARRAVFHDAVAAVEAVQPSGAPVAPAVVTLVARVPG